MGTDIKTTSIADFDPSIIKFGRFTFPDEKNRRASPLRESVKAGERWIPLK